ncbi:hypothetical protein KP001_07105 [Geomonas subterranea]|uniref:PDZ domain-containing protein n=2 Tax=Geomonas subterranea TaxID=2847989 RepID=A0ABX8LJS3_9BACT|nr:hypothetical protein [Geomonas subterranea]QXE92283.1 hypothetical protein KP001_07105 [Geomonas subterranea]
MKRSFMATPCAQTDGTTAAGRVASDEGAGTLSFLGMTLTEIELDGEKREKHGKRGVVALVVDRNQEAWLGGVRNGDLIAEVSSTRIGSIADLKRVLRGHDPHDPIFIFVLGERGWRFVNLSFIASAT